MSPSDGRVHMNINVRNEMSPGNRVGPEELRPAIDAMHGALGKHRALIGSIEGLFGRAVAESLRRSLEPIEDASDRADYAAMSVDREFENSRGYAMHVAEQEAELAKALDLSTMQAERDRFNSRQISRRTEKPRTVTLLEAVDFIQSERVRLVTELHAVRADAERERRALTAARAAYDDWASQRAHPRSVKWLIRRVDKAIQAARDGAS